MITVDTCGMTNYSPLIPAIKAMCNANPGDKMEIERIRWLHSRILRNIYQNKVSDSVKYMMENG